MKVLITGASRGLGKAIAHQFAAQGASLCLVARNETLLSSVKEGLLQAFPTVQVQTYGADLSDKQAIQTLHTSVTTHFGIPDILVNNAGSFQPGTIAEEEEGLLESMLQHNLMSAYWLTRWFLPAMQSRKSGHIFNMCSIASLQAYANGGSYSISKFALLGFSKNLREELKPFGIKVTSILPGAVYTDSWAGSGVDPNRIMEANDIALMIVAASQLSPQACVEELLIRPQLGDL